MKEKIKNLIPRKLITTLKFYYVFNKLWNHSPRKGELNQNINGDPVPWITYPAIEFLDKLDFSNFSIFEYGSGSSTLYWSQKAKKVTSVERDFTWFNLVKPKLPNNCQLIHQGDELLYPKVILETNEKFDLIVIDGAVRYPCMEASVNCLKPSGLVLLDNLEWYPQTAQKLRELGFFQIDFSGFPPQNAFTSCTSLFFKDPQVFNQRVHTPDWKPVGGRYLLAHDDKPLDQIDPQTLVRNG